MHIHLDALGGMAGDMFAAAILDAFPELEPRVMASVAAATAAAPVLCNLVAHTDGILQGRRFHVELKSAPASLTHRHHHHDLHQGEDQAGHGAHRHWSDIRAMLADSNLDPAVRDRAIAIFQHLAQAEAKVHGIEVERVAFHEVGAWDSIADIVVAATLIAALGAEQWSVSALPLGSGRVMTAHGALPIPAPATALLLQGFTMMDDGIGGERITPTGAAILRHLCGAAPTRASGPRVMSRSGVGFGTMTLPGISNCVRALVFDTPEGAAASGHRTIGVIEFEVDDQSAEDLAMGLDRLREHRDIFDVVQMPMFGKKGRMTTHVRVLARAIALEAAIEACFRETTTIGLRHHVVSGATLERRMVTVDHDGRPMRVKIVDRPGGRTAKAESDDALAHETHATRAAARREAERLALRQAGDHP